MTAADNRPTLAVTLGDPAGIGPEVVVKALADPEIAALARFVLVGDQHVLAAAARACGVDLPDPSITTVRHVDTLEGVVPPVGRLDAAAGRAAVAYVREATDMCLRGEAVAMVTAPINKAAVALSGQTFSGHTEYIAERCGATDSRMMLANERLSVVHVSTHIALRDACTLTAAGIVRTIELGREALVWLGRDAPRIAVCGLNPHAGEGGLFGDEEREIVIPAIAAARARHLPCEGPFAPDTIFIEAWRGAWDLVVVMYHDQGHIPMKLLDFAQTVNVTLGIPIVRTSVDHGTAFDIAGRGLADPTSMKAAIRLGARMGARRRALAPESAGPMKRFGSISPFLEQGHTERRIGRPVANHDFIKALVRFGRFDEVVLANPSVANLAIGQRPVGACGCPTMPWCCSRSDGSRRPRRWTRRRCSRPWPTRSCPARSGRSCWSSPAAPRKPMFGCSTSWPTPMRFVRTRASTRTSWRGSRSTFSPAPTSWWRSPTTRRRPLA